jgi:hypothetical protein
MIFNRSKRLTIFRFGDIIIHGGVMNQSTSLNKTIIRFFRAADFPVNINGYNYAKVGMAYAIENNGVDSNKILLFHIAEQCKESDIHNIERCLRTLIGKTWPKLTEMGIVNSKPTVREFFIRCMEYITLENDIG